MKIFIYKTLILLIAALLLFKLTFVNLIKEYESKILTNFGKERLEYTKIKLKDEIQNSLKKDKILSDEDAKLLREFFIKIKNEIYPKN